MATKAELNEVFARLCEDLDSRPESTGEAERWLELAFISSQTWAIVSAKGDWFDVLYRLGDTKGEALEHLRAMRQGIALFNR